MARRSSTQLGVPGGLTHWRGWRQPPRPDHPCIVCAPIGHVCGPERLCGMRGLEAPRGSPTTARECRRVATSRNRAGSRGISGLTMRPTLRPFGPRMGHGDEPLDSRHVRDLQGNHGIPRGASSLSLPAQPQQPVAPFAPTLGSPGTGPARPTREASFVAAQTELGSR
jgi:hypothetical protein